MEEELNKEAERNAEQYDRMFRRAARAAFIEGAKWYASRLNREPEKEYYGL